MNVVNRTMAVLLATVTAAIAVPAEAAVMFHAFDSKGKDTGTCAERVSGGYVLKACNAATTAQKFSFDSGSTVGTTISQSTECLVAPLGAWAAGTWIAGRPCTSTGAPNFTSKLWRRSGTKIIGTESPSQGFCLSADGVNYTPPKLIEQVCGSASLLTQWSVVTVP